MRHAYRVYHTASGESTCIRFNTFKAARAEFMWKGIDRAVCSYLWVDDRLRARWRRSITKHPSWFDIKEVAKL